MVRLPVALRYVLAVSVFGTAAAVDLCAQTSRPPMEISGAARLLSFTGRLVVQRENSPWRLDVGESVYPGEVVSTGSDGSGMFQVADGSTFEVFPNSKIVFRANRGNWEDLLELWLGKVRIQIEHPGGLPNNNKVRTPTAVISVRGTIFDVDYDADADATTVLDEEGSVEVARAMRLDDKKILGPNETVKVYKNESLARKIDTGGILKRVFQSAMDALSQQAINSRTSTPAAGAGSVGSTPTVTGGGSGGASAGDKNNNPTPPPPPPPPAP